MRTLKEFFFFFKPILKIKDEYGNTIIDIELSDFKVPKSLDEEEDLIERILREIQESVPVKPGNIYTISLDGGEATLDDIFDLKRYGTRGKTYKNINGFSIKIKERNSDEYTMEILRNNKLEEVKGIFGDAAQKKLSAKSAQSLKDMLGGKSFMQAGMENLKMLPELMKIEEPYRGQLTDLAIQTVERAFPFIKKAGIEIEAELVPSPSEMKITKRDYENTPNEENFEESFSKGDLDKRQIINSISQGAGLRGTKVYYMFDDILDILDKLGVKGKYEELVNNAYGIYDDDAAISMLLSMLSMSSNTPGQAQGGESEAVFDEKADKLVIKAKALTFPILLQEIIKGLYELVSYDGIEPGKEGITQKDKLSDEPEAMRYGKFIYDGLRDLVNQYAENPDQVREEFLSEVYKLDSSWFKIFIENVINDQLTSDQKTWVEKTIKDLENTDEETEEDGDQPVGIS